MKVDKATLELLEALEDYGTDKITTLFNEIYDTVRFYYSSPNLYL